MLNVVLAFMAEAGSAATVWKVGSLEQEDFGFWRMVGEDELFGLAQVGVELEADLLEQRLVEKSTLTSFWFAKTPLTIGTTVLGKQDTQYYSCDGSHHGKDAEAGNKPEFWASRTAS